MVTALDGPEAGKAGAHSQSPSLPALVLSNLARDGRAGADQRHVALHDVEQLRQFVQREFPKPFSNWREPWVIGDFCRDIPAGQMRHFVKPLFRIDYHGPELVKG